MSWEKCHCYNFVILNGQTQSCSGTWLCKYIWNIDITKKKPETSNSNYWDKSFVIINSNFFLTFNWHICTSVTVKKISLELKHTQYCSTQKQQNVNNNNNTPICQGHVFVPQAELMRQLYQHQFVNW